jgi:PEP-CTERM motif
LVRCGTRQIVIRFHLLFSMIYVELELHRTNGFYVSSVKILGLVTLVGGHRCERRGLAVMKFRFLLWAVVALLCLVAPLMAGPIPISAPSSPGYAMSNSGLGFSELDILSSSYKQAPDTFNLQRSMDNPRGPNLQESMDDPLPANPLPATGSDGAIGRYEGPNPGPTAIQRRVPEPSGLMVMMGSGLFGAGAFLRRRLKA